jgi:hypothetical protein
VERMKREYLWALMTLVAAILLAFILLNIAEKDAPSEPVQQVQRRVVCVDTDTRERIRAIALEAYDAAFKGNLQHLYDILLHDTTAVGVQRASTGAQNSIAAYVKARELALAWNPPEC